MVSGSGMEGVGSVHVRERVISPVPQLFAHGDQSDHEEKPPSTRREREKDFILNTLTVSLTDTSSNNGVEIADILSSLSSIVFALVEIVLGSIAENTRITGGILLNRIESG